MSMDLKPEQCIRLYDSSGKHILTLLHCNHDNKDFDLATPEGRVLQCSNVNDPLYLVLLNRCEKTILDNKCPQLLLHLKEE